MQDTIVNAVKPGWVALERGPLAIVILCSLAGCTPPDIPLPEILQMPVKVDRPVAASRVALSSCLYEEARKGDIYHVTILPGVAGTIPMPKVNIVERGTEATDIDVQLSQEFSPNAALFRLSGNNPTRVVLHWQYERTTEGGAAKIALYSAPYIWLENCEKRLSPIN